MKSISMIVPAYQAERTLARCLDSLVNQTLQDIEIIVVNDGSTDQTREILNTYVAKYSDKIIAINQENQGVSMARNHALSVATGEYIGFLDSDDYVELDMLNTMYQKAISSNYDMVACDVIAHYPDRDVLIPSNVHDQQEIKGLLIDAYAVLWNKIFKRDCIKELQFKPNVWYEDVLFLYQAYLKLSTVGSVSKTFCHYLQNEGSITYTYNDKLFDLLSNLDDIIKYYKEQSYYDSYKDELEYMYARYALATFPKRLSKCKNHQKYHNEMKLVRNRVNRRFPNYKINRYLKKKGLKNLYIRNFNIVFAELIYQFEKNKMN